MIPILYRGDETLFNSNGLGRLANCLRCEVTEERNGIYECEFDMPVTSPMYPAVALGCIIYTTHDATKTPQAFDIYAKSAELEGVVTFYAHHISYRLNHVILKPFTAANCALALAGMETEVYNRNPFSFWTDKAVSAPWTNAVPASVRSRLMGEQGSILDVYGKGEYLFDMFTVRLYVNRGNDNGVSIRYGVNLTKLGQDLDASGAYSAVAPYWRSADGETVVLLPEGYITAGEVPVKRYPWTTSTGEYMTTSTGEILEFGVADVVPVPMDLSDAFDEPPTAAQLRATAQSRLNNSEAWLPDENITISFQPLADTADYADVAALQRVSLCDRVNVYCGPLGVQAAKVEVVRTVYDALNEKYVEMELGQPKASYADALMARVDSAIQSSAENTRGFTAAAIENATNQITGANGGYVRFVYDADGNMTEILIMDTDSVTTATKVWRWNSGGLGFSSNGYGGPYTTAITQDGSIVADFITSGYMLANVIRGGVLTLGGTNNANGIMQVKDAEGNNVAQIDASSFLYSFSSSYDQFQGSVRIDGRYGLQIQTRHGSSYFWDMGTGDGEYTHSSQEFAMRTFEDEAGYFEVRLMSYGIEFYRWIKDTEPGTYRGRKLARIELGTIELTDGDTNNGVNISTRTGLFRFNCAQFTVSGTKSRSVATDQYADRLLYCYETPSPMFGDVGEGEIGEDGRCYIWLDPVFAQTVATDSYQVFLQRYGSGECWIAERRPGCFVVEGSPGLRFGWEIKAKQRDFDQKRLERDEAPFTVPEQTFGEDAAAHLADLAAARLPAA